MAEPYNYEPVLHRLLAVDDVASLVVSMLTPIEATKLRGSSKPALASVTNMHALWQLWAAPFQGSNTASSEGLSAFAKFPRHQFMCKHRETLLSAALRARNRSLRIRNDSWLCANYIAGRREAGTLAAVVDGVEEMNFLFRATDYILCRELVAAEQWEDACEMAEDAGEPINPDYYHVALEPPVLSAAAKRRALQRFLSEHGREAAMDRAPACVRSRLVEVSGDESADSADSAGSSAPAEQQHVRYAALDDDAKCARREGARRRAREIEQHEHMVLEALFAQLHQVEAGPVGGEHTFEASLSARVRAFLHTEADELGLEHESRGHGPERHLVVRKPAEAPMGMEEGADDDDDDDDSEDDDDDDDEDEDEDEDGFGHYVVDDSPSSSEAEDMDGEIDAAAEPEQMIS